MRSDCKYGVKFDPILFFLHSRPRPFNKYVQSIIYWILTRQIAFVAVELGVCMLSETLQKNKAARETAESVMALAEENLTDQINHQRFWETLAKLAMSRGGLASRPNMSEALNEFESKHFETLSMPFGKYKDQPVGKVPCDYLSWCTENDFGDQLRRYVLSDRFKIRNVEEHKEEFTDG